MALLPTLEELKRVDTSHDLILSLTADQEIIQFNRESEQFTGFHRDEVLHKKLSDVLIPRESSSEWASLLVSIQKNMWIDNFVLPLKTKSNQVHMIIWTGFLVKDEHGVVKDICIFGKPVQTQQVKQPNTREVHPKPVQKEPPHQEESPPFEIQPATPPGKTETPSEPCSPSLTPPMKLPVSTEILQRSPPKEVVPREKEPAVIFQPPVISEKPKTTSPPVPPPVARAEPQPLRKEMHVKHGTKKMMFAPEKDKTTGQRQPIISEKPSPPVSKGVDSSDVHVLEKQYDVTAHKLDSILESLSEVSQKYEEMLKRVAELEKKKESLMEKNQVSPQNPPQIRPPQASMAVPVVKNTATGTDKEANGKKQIPEEKEYTFFSDPFGLKRQHSELDVKKQRIDLRMKQLESFESRLMKEKDLLHSRVQEFSKWQEKLITLESEIERRRQEVMKQETLALEKKSHLSPVQSISSRKDSLRDAEADLPHSDDETLERIPQSAAIIQRGILKQINSQFLELLGYPPEDIIEKSYFDFIALEGLADVEKYYLDRLKGDGASVYRTVFSARDNKKIAVEVSIKQTIYNGEKAEIAIVTSLTSVSI